MNRISDGSLYPTEIPHYMGNGRPAVSKQMGSGRFDQLQISQTYDDVEKKVMELTGQVSQQVRVRHTAGELSLLQQQIREGTYQPDAREIAAKMLLEGL